MATSGTQQAVSYKYRIKLKYMGGSEDYEVRTESIKTLIVDHNYDYNTMPIMYIQVSLDKKMTDDIIKNQMNAYFILTVSGYDSTATFGTETDAFNVKCTYFLPDDMNKFDTVDYNENVAPETMENTFAPVSIGLMVVDHINNNRKDCTTALQFVHPFPVVQQLIHHMKNRNIEPFDYNPEYERLLIPPNMATSVNKAVQYINNQQVFYKTPYRLYQDFNTTHLISSSGKGHPTKDGSDSMFGRKIAKIIIKVNEVDDMSSSVSGLVNGIISAVLAGISSAIGGALGGAIGGAIGGALGGIGGGGGDPGGGGGSGGETVQVNVNYGNVQVMDTTITNKTRNRVVGMKLQYDKADLKSKSELTKDITLSRRMNNENKHMLENIKADDDSKNFLLFFTKTDLDCTLFSINKQILIDNAEQYKELNGAYLLYRKKEMYTRQEDDFVLNSLIYLRRIDTMTKAEDGKASGSGSYYEV